MKRLVLLSSGLLLAGVACLVGVGIVLLTTREHRPAPTQVRRQAPPDGPTSTRGPADSQSPAQAPAEAHPPSLPTVLPQATVDFLDVGQGDSILIRSPEGKTVLVDAGPSKSVVRLLRERDVVGIDLAVVTHHHIDHYYSANLKVPGKGVGA